MNKKGNLIKYLSIATFTFILTILIGGMNVYAAGEHQFSFKFYDCGTLDESKLTDTVDTERNRVTENASIVCSNANTPLLSTTNVGGNSVVKVTKGSVVKVGIHYVPGTNTDIGMQIKYFYDSDSFEPVNFTVYNRTSRTYSTKLANTLGEDFADFYDQWVVNPANPNPGRITMFVNDSRASAGDPLIDELDIVYFYFRVKEDATMNTSLPFTFDTTVGTGTVMNNKSGVAVTDANLYVEKPLSTDNTLETLSVTDGTNTYTLDPVFDPTKTNYSVVVANSVSSITLNAHENDDYAVLSGDTGNQSLNVGNNTFEISVLSESGVPKVYTINVYRLSNDNTLSSLSLSNVDFGTFNSNTTSYTASVPYTTSKTNVSATVHDTGKATVSGTGNNKALNVGTTNITVTVTPENCKSQYSNVPNNTCVTKDYTVTVTRANPSTNNYLSALNIDGALIQDFNKATQTYNITVDSNVSSINITATPEDTKSQVGGTGNKTLSVGNQSFNITVTPEDPNTEVRTYTVNVHKKDSNNNLLSLSVTSNPQGTLDKTFNANTTEYTYTVGPDVTAVVITATKPDSASISGTGTYNPQTQTKAEITVTPEQGQAKKYTINLVRTKSTNADLSSLGVEGFTISPAFNANTKNYTLTVPSTTNTVNVQATLADIRAHLSGDIGTQSVSTGNNTFTITVTAEDNQTTKDYKIVVTKQDGDATLKSLNLTNVTLVPDFAHGTTSYTATVPYTVTSTNVTAEATSTKATVTGDLGNNALQVGTNTIAVTVTAEDTNVHQTYTVTVTRENPSTNNYLSDLKVDNTLVTDFNKNTQTYNLTVDSSVSSVNITATPEDTKSEVGGTGSKTLATGNNTFNITVDPEDPNTETRTYTVNIYKKDGNSNLGSLSITSNPAGALDIPFDPSVTEYTYTVGPDVTEVVVTATPGSDNATVGGTGTFNPLDTDKVVITVTPEDGTPKEYTINLVRNQSTENDLLSLSVQGYTLSPAFNRNRLTYDVVVPSTETSVNIIAQAVNFASVSGDGIQILTGKVTEIPVRVTAEDHSYKDYTITVTKQDADATLSSLTLTNVTLDQTFDPSVTNYTATVPYTTESTTITAETTSNTSTPTGDLGDRALQVGENTFTITVTAEDTNIQETYTVVVTRTAASNDAKLSDIKINNQSISDFDPAQTEYTIDVTEDTTSINVSADTENEFAQVGGQIGDQPLQPGNNDIVITVQAQDGTPNQYVIHVNRELNDNNYLASLTVEGFTFTEAFEKTKQSYQVVVPANTTSVNVSATTEVTTSTPSGDLGDVTLNTTDEPTVIVVSVTSQKGNIRNYQITVTKENSEPEIEYITSVQYGHIIADGMIKDIKSLITPETLKDQLDNENSKLHIYKTNEDTEEIDDTANVGTGYVVKLIKDGVLNDSKITVVKGDVNGDGQIRLNDAVAVLNHYLEMEGKMLVAGSAQFIAADCSNELNGDGQIRLNDAVAVLQLYLNN